MTTLDPQNKQDAAYIEAVRRIFKETTIALGNNAIINWTVVSEMILSISKTHINESGSRV